LKLKNPNIPNPRRGVLALSLLCLALALALPCPAQTPEDKEAEATLTDAKRSFKEHVEPFVKQYCAECHGDRPKAGLNLKVAVRKPGDPAFSRKWMECIANVNAHDMPPDDADQPTGEERQRFIDSLAKLKYLSTRDPGPFVIRRLTKSEYGNTLHDLLGVDASVAAELPNEVAGEGYMNSLSPLQSEQYLGIANAALQKMTAAAQTRLLGGKNTTVREVARTLARRAYRRPPTDAELDVLVRVFDLGRTNQLDHTASLRLMLKAVLVSPQFLFITPAKDAEANQKIVPLDDCQLASRLSYLLWATMPDAELSELADAGKLHEPAVLKAQTKRMLADPRARALFDGFGAQWLGLSELKDKTFDPAKFPQMTGEMRSAMVEEARRFFESIVRENRSVVSFVDSDYTFLNGTLATLYGMEKTITGPQMRQVKLTNPNRGGILGMPGILATTSFPNRTSPVNRGVWVLEQVLGEHVPPAPPNVPTLEKQDQKKVGNLTLRQRTELHRTNAVCNNCHKILDPIGFGLENFDAIGRWRDQDDTGGKIDAAGELPGGKRFSSPKELKSIIAARKDDLARNLTEKVLAYALCRKLGGYDEIVVDRMMKTITKDGYKMQTLITEIVTSYPFLNRRIQ
jgi:mono/diheme cytochrome c family protein